MTEPRPREMPLHRRAVAVLFFQSAACFFLGFGIRGDIGAGTTIGFAVTQALSLLALVDRRLVWFPRVVLSTIATYMGLLAGDVVLALVTRSAPQPSSALSMYAMYAKDDEIGFHLAPDWQFVNDDGTVHIRTNSLGHRDDEPQPESGKLQAVLIGDSFTFGQGLIEGQTIDKIVEEASGGKFDAYNLGVPGYGPPQILKTLERNDSPPDTAVIYLYYANDLGDYGLRVAPATVIDGYLVQARDQNSRIIPESELRDRLQRELSGKRSSDWASRIRLMSIRSAVAARFGRSLIGTTTTKTSDDNIASGVEYTTQMQNLTRERRQDFAVFIIPTVGETKAQRYSWPTEGFIEQLRTQNIPTIQVRDELTVDDYLKNDWHFSASGAKKAGEAIKRYLEKKLR